MEEIVITCNSCEVQRTISHVEDSMLNDTEVALKAGHTPVCPLKRATNVKIDREQRVDEPNVSLYVISEVK